MLTDKENLKSEVREFTGYNTKTLPQDGLDTAYRTAKRHVRTKSGKGADFEWYNTEFPERQDTLFWWTCLFTKVQTGELDSQDLQIGAVDQKALLAKDDDSVTMWYRNADAALRTLMSSAIFQSASPARGDREYSPGTFEPQNGSSGSDSVDNTEL